MAVLSIQPDIPAGLNYEDEKRKGLASLWKWRCFVDILLAEGDDVVPGASVFVEVGAEDLALENGDFVEGEDHSGLCVRGDWLHPEDVFGEDLLLIDEAAFCAFLALDGEAWFGE